MSSWIAVAERLKAAKEARQEFLWRDFVDKNIIGPLLLDRVAADLSRSDGVGAGADYSVQPAYPDVDDR